MRSLRAIGVFEVFGASGEVVTATSFIFGAVPPLSLVTLQDPDAKVKEVSFEITLAAHGELVSDRR